jgi:hypothetical protein
MTHAGQDAGREPARRPNAWLVLLGIVPHGGWFKSGCNSLVRHPGAVAEA